MNAADERARLLRARLSEDGLLTPEIAARLETPWRTNGVLVQIVFFALTCVAMGAFYGLCNVLSVPGEGIVTGVLAIAVAEYLIHAKRWWATGVEIALWVGGLFSFISELPSNGTPEAMLVLGAACAIAGRRVRNPIAGAVAAIFVMTWAEKRLDLGVLAALLMALAAIFLLLRTWQRPTTEWLLIAIAIVLPVAGWFHADAIWRNVTILLYAAFAAIAFALAMRKRHHAFFFAALIACAIAAFELARTVAGPEELKIAVAGAALLGLAFVATRILKDKTSGFVSTRTRYHDTLETLVTITAAPSPAPSAPQPASGGNFGGAGASGNL
ncbi:MAG TPA: hypothetical protein VEK11_09235 [Thermoanaerobaculia bacterium]|nr:hypothetical protein [Thermoanaerobaculia bacterium]